MSESIGIDLVWRLEETLPGRAWPPISLSFNGLPVHLFALRVKQAEDDPRAQVAWQDDFADEFEARIRANSGDQFQTAALPGLEGSWVIFAEAHAQ